MSTEERPAPQRRGPARGPRSLTAGGRVVTSVALVAAVVAATTTAGPAAPPQPPDRAQAASATVALQVPADAALEDASSGWSGSLGDSAPDSTSGAGIPGLRGSILTPATLRAGALPPRVEAAYRGAADRLAAEEPRCGLPWWLLAGVGQVESGHAAGGRVHDDGATLSPIRGPRLDGTLAGTAVVRDSDRGGLDGDAVFDRAVGPMQFMPGTWASWGADGDGDGREDPDDVDDAALAAGRYLCSGATDGALAGQGGQAAALFRYNRSVSYGLEVIRWGIAFRDGTAAPLAPRDGALLVSGSAPVPDGAPPTSPGGAPAPGAPAAPPGAPAPPTSPDEAPPPPPAADPSAAEPALPPSAEPALPPSAEPVQPPTEPVVCPEPAEPGPPEPTGAPDAAATEDPTAPTAPPNGQAVPGDPDDPAAPCPAPCTPAEGDDVPASVDGTGQPSTTRSLADDGTPSGPSADETTDGSTPPECPALPGPPSPPDEDPGAAALPTGP